MDGGACGAAVDHTLLTAADAGIDATLCTFECIIGGTLHASMVHARWLRPLPSLSPSGILGKLQPADQVAPDVFQDVVETNVLGV